MCARYLEPEIGHLTCQEIKIAHMRAAVNAAPTSGEGARLRRCISALVGAGMAGGYLANARLKDVHWQACGRAIPVARPRSAGESALFVDPGEIPAADDVARLGEAVALTCVLYELMVNFAAYIGLQWGELAALTVGQIIQATRVVLVNRKLVEVRGHLFVEAPKNRKWRRTIYPRVTPAGYPLAELVAARVRAVEQEQAAGLNLLGLMFPAPAGGYLRSSNFNRRVLQASYRVAGWRDANSRGDWTWHSLRHVFCTTALFTWKMDVTDVSRLAGHSSYRVTMDMYIGNTAGTLDRAYIATG